MEETRRTAYIINESLDLDPLEIAFSTGDELWGFVLTFNKGVSIKMSAKGSNPKETRVFMLNKFLVSNSVEAAITKPVSSKRINLFINLEFFIEWLDLKRRSLMFNSIYCDADIKKKKTRDTAK